MRLHHDDHHADDDHHGAADLLDQHVNDNHDDRGTLRHVCH
jgi:hypothetical protein